MTDDELPDLTNIDARLGYLVANARPFARGRTIFHAAIDFITFVDWPVTETYHGLVTPAVWANLQKQRVPNDIRDGWWHFSPLALKVCTMLPGMGTTTASNYFWRDLRDLNSIVEYKHDDTAII